MKPIIRCYKCGEKMEYKGVDCGLQVYVCPKCQAEDRTKKVGP